MLSTRRLASRTSTALLHLHPSRPFRACLSAVPDLFAPPVQPCVLACACRLVVLVGALAHGWYPCPSPLRPCLRGTAHGCGLAFQPLGCCPCHCAQNIPVKVRPGGFGCGDALRNLRSLRFRAWGCPRARGALAGVSALAGGRFRRRSGLIFISPALPPSRGLQPHHLPISIPTRRQEYASSMAITALLTLATIPLETPPWLADLPIPRILNLPFSAIWPTMAQILVVPMSNPTINLLFSDIMLMNYSSVLVFGQF